MNHVQEFGALNPGQQLAVLKAHPDLHTYPESRQRAIVKDRVKKDSRNTKLAVKKDVVEKQAVEQKAATVSVPVRTARDQNAKPLDTTGWVHPSITHHDTLDSMSEALRSAADNVGASKKLNMAPVHAALDKADAHLEDHMAAHTTNEAAIASGHIDEAAKSISEAARAFHILSPYKGGPDPVASKATGVAADYRAYVAEGQRAGVRYSPRASVGAYVGPSAAKRDRSYTNEAVAAENERGAAKKAEAEAEYRRKNPSKEELAARKAAGDKAVKESLQSIPDTPADPNRISVPTSPAERASMRAKAEAKRQSWSVKGAAPVDLSGRVNPQAREHVLHHAKIALDSLKAGQKIPSDSSRILGPAGIKAVKAQHNDWEAQNSEAREKAQDNTGIFEGIVKPGRTGSFNQGRGV